MLVLFMLVLFIGPIPIAVFMSASCMRPPEPGLDAMFMCGSSRQVFAQQETPHLAMRGF